MKIHLLFFVFIKLFATSCFSQIPAGYYNSAQGLTGVSLKNALHTIITNGQNVGNYASLWTSYQTTDVRSNGKVWDMYSDIPGSTPPYYFTFISNQCGTYSAESDCYNREHSVPESWFNGASPMYSDLFHVVPADGYVNNRRSNYPFGKVATASWISQNGSKLGTSAVSGYSGIVFEPIDSFKGDFARIYFYMATRYQDVLSSWSGDPFSGTDLTLWAKNLFLQWNALDPVSAKEMARNNTVYNIQNNRNPYVDHPEWIPLIWGTASGISESTADFKVIMYPTPACDVLNISIDNTFFQMTEVTIFQTDCKMLIHHTFGESKLQLNVSSLPVGIYFINFKNNYLNKTQKFVVIR
jgi:endonuclease I